MAPTGQDDIHFPTLSVNTTLRFALNARRPTTDPHRTAHLKDDLQTVLQLMGLDHVGASGLGMIV
ncbi:hypothetical protein BJX99DRAFT_252840 [Aspergillus californicus]